MQYGEGKNKSELLIADFWLPIEGGRGQIGLQESEVRPFYLRTRDLQQFFAEINSKITSLISTLLQLSRHAAVAAPQVEDIGLWRDVI